MEGFIKYMRSEEAINLHSNKNANHLLSIIAFRASRKGNPVLGVKPGEAFIGDYKKMGLTHREYRTAITNLVKWGYVTTITTNKGTIAKLCNSDVYDINSDLFDKQTTIQRQTKDKQETTINNERKKEIKNTKSDFLDNNSKRKNKEEIRATLYKIFGPDEVHVENIIQGFKKTFMIFLSEEFVVQERAKFMLLDFNKYKYNKLQTDFEIEDALYKFLHKGYTYSDKKKSTSLRKQTDYKAYLINFWTNEHPNCSEHKAKRMLHQFESTGVLEQRIKKFKEIREDLISYHKKYFSKYPKLLLFDILDFCYDKRSPFSAMRIQNNPTDKMMQRILKWLERQYKEREYHMNTKSIRANIEIVKRQHEL
jgi:hypothetical protein